MSSSMRSADAPIAASGPAAACPARPEDPYRALDGLMEVLEALCPTWPQRPVARGGGKYRL
jgi:hypothetical protein